MKFNLKNELHCLYEQWLMDTCPEDVRCKEDLMEMSRTGHLFEEFVKEVLKELREI